MSRFLTLLVLSTSGAVAASAQEAQPGLRDAFALAVERFDPDGVRGLRGDDASVRFMTAALAAVAADFPAMASFGRHPNADLTLHQWDFLNIYVRGDTLRAGRDSSIVALERELSLGCLVVEEQRVVSAPATEEEFTRWDLSAPSCNGSWAAELRAAGPLLLTSWTSSSRWTAFRVLRLESSPSQPRDIRAVLRELKASSPRLAPLLEQGEPPLAEVGLGDPVRSIDLIADATQDPFRTPFRLRYTFSWGDCPSGCANDHWWVYRLVPSPQPDLEWEFRVELIDEDGDPLPRTGWISDPPNRELLLRG